MSRNTVAARDEDGDVIVHEAGHVAGYHTLCGLSLDDDTFQVAEARRGARINCSQCHEVWKEARGLRADDFAKELK